jgi:hypothetical protein
VEEVAGAMEAAGAVIGSFRVWGGPVGVDGASDNDMSLDRDVDDFGVRTAARSLPAQNSLGSTLGTVIEWSEVHWVRYSPEKMFLNPGKEKSEFQEKETQLLSFEVPREVRLDSYSGVP